MMRNKLISYTKRIPYVTAEITVYYWTDEHAEMTYSATATFKENYKIFSSIPSDLYLPEMLTQITLNGKDENVIKEINKAVIRRFALYYLHKAFDGKYMNRLVRSFIKPVILGLIRINCFDIGNSNDADLTDTLHYLEDNGYAVKCDSCKDIEFEDIKYNPMVGLTMNLTDKGREWVIREAL